MSGFLKCRANSITKLRCSRRATSLDPKDSRRRAASSDVSPTGERARRCSSSSSGNGPGSPPATFVMIPYSLCREAAYEGSPSAAPLEVSLNCSPGFSQVPTTIGTLPGAPPPPRGHPPARIAPSSVKPKIPPSSLGGAPTRRGAARPHLERFTSPKLNARNRPKLSNLKKKNSSAAQNAK